MTTDDTRPLSAEGLDMIRKRHGDWATAAGTFGDNLLSHPDEECWGDIDRHRLLNILDRRLAPTPDPLRNPSAEPYYLPMDCPVCGRRRMEWDGKVLSCEKCRTSSEWDGFSRERFAPTPDPLPPANAALMGDIQRGRLTATPAPALDVERLARAIHDTHKYDDPNNRPYCPACKRDADRYALAYEESR